MASLERKGLLNQSVYCKIPRVKRKKIVRFINKNWFEMSCLMTADGPSSPFMLISARRTGDSSKIANLTVYDFSNTGNVISACKAGFDADSNIYVELEFGYQIDYSNNFIVLNLNGSLIEVTQEEEFLDTPKTVVGIIKKM